MLIIQIGTVGHSVVDNINEALQEWSAEHMKMIKYVMKGQNCLTEMYSAIAAEVPIPTDPNTKTNLKLLNELVHKDVEKVIIFIRILLLI